jgi:hypothetical protein
MIKVDVKVKDDKHFGIEGVSNKYILLMLLGFNN